MSQQNQDPYADVDWEREDNLPPSALINMGLGLAVAVLMVLCAGIGAIANEIRGDGALMGAVIGAIVGVVLAILFVIVQRTRLRGEGR